MLQLVSNALTPDALFPANAPEFDAVTIHTALVDACNTIKPLWLDHYRNGATAASRKLHNAMEYLEKQQKALLDE